MISDGVRSGGSNTTVRPAVTSRPAGFFYCEVDRGQ
jgi:hypothetical protein